MNVHIIVTGSKSGNTTSWSSFHTHIHRQLQLVLIYVLGFIFRKCVLSEGSTSDAKSIQVPSRASSRSWRMTSLGRRAPSSPACRPGGQGVSRKRAGGSRNAVSTVCMAWHQWSSGRIHRCHRCDMHFGRTQLCEGLTNRGNSEHFPHTQHTSTLSLTHVPHTPLALHTCLQPIPLAISGEHPPRICARS